MSQKAKRGGPSDMPGAAVQVAPLSSVKLMPAEFAAAIADRERVLRDPTRRSARRRPDDLALTRASIEALRSTGKPLPRIPSMRVVRTWSPNGTPLPEYCSVLIEPDEELVASASLPAPFVGLVTVVARRLPVNDVAPDGSNATWAALAGAPRTRTATDHRGKSGDPATHPPEPIEFLLAVGAPSADAASSEPPGSSSARRPETQRVARKFESAPLLARPIPAPASRPIGGMSMADLRHLVGVFLLLDAWDKETDR